jgi:HD superfamily phosphodiesterase
MTKYEQILKSAEKYMRVRKNDVHIPLSFGYAMRLADAYPEADRDIVAAAIILHDTGWHSIDEEDIFSKGFGPNMMESDVRFLHEKEGVRLSREVLSELNYPEDFIQRVGEIIDGHDTRKFSKSLEDEIVRDADKLWRFSVTGISVACDWFKMTPHQYIERLKAGSIHDLHLDKSLEMAKADLEHSIQTLMCHII